MKYGVLEKIGMLSPVYMWETYLHMGFLIHSLQKVSLCFFSSPLGLCAYQTDTIMGIGNEWSPTGKFTPFKTPFTNWQEIMAALALTRNFIHQVEMEYHGKF